jgi:hypothetical protein
MHLGISSEAAPAATLAELFAGCDRRGLSGIEAVAGHAHRIEAEPEDVQLAIARQKPAVLSYRVHSWREALSDESAGLSARIAAPVVVPGLPPEPEALDLAETLYSRAGGELLVALPPDAREIEAFRQELQRRDGTIFGIALEVRPAEQDLSRTQEVLQLAGRQLKSVRLHGGGPEAGLQTGMGIGPLLGALTLNRYAHPLLLRPSDPRNRRAWAKWLGREGAWGCGSRTPLPLAISGPAKN